MANINDLYYHGIAHQVRRVIKALGEERTDKGLTAFEDGHSNWSDCFFARALKDDVNLNHEGEIGVAKFLGFTSPSTKSGYNLIPVRIVYRAFDGNSSVLTKQQMRDLITNIRDETRPDEVMQLLRSINFEQAEETPVEFSGVSCAI